MSGVELFQIWLIAFFTLALFSFLYKDNPIYRVAEHIFAGLTAGYQVGLIWDTVILQKLWDPMVGGDWWLFIPGILGLLMFTRLTKKFSWASRISLAFVMGVTAGIFIISQLHGLVLPQMKDTMIASSEEISKLENKATDNLGQLTIFDPDIVLDTVVIDTTSSDILATADIDTLTDTTASMAKKEVETITYPYLHSESQLSIYEEVNRKGDETVTLTAKFVDTLELGMLDFYAPSFKIRKKGTTSDQEIVKANVYTNNGIILTNNSDGSITVTYDYNPADNLEVGEYSLGFEVERKSVMLLLTIIIVIGVLSTLIYFYFSHEHKGALGVTAKVGIWFIMISFGAHFGYTVMGRVSLLIGRMQFLIEDWIGSFSHIF